jgi:probable rRNA maturation factor
MGEGSYSEINPHILGDVVISVETARRVADEGALTLDDVLYRLLIHGVLHLVGYDHEGPEEQALLMENREDEILQAVMKQEPARRKR